MKNSNRILYAPAAYLYGEAGTTYYKSKDKRIYENQLSEQKRALCEDVRPQK